MWNPAKLGPLESWLTAQYSLGEMLNLTGTLVMTRWHWSDDHVFHDSPICLFCQSVLWEALRLKPPPGRQPLAWEVLGVLQWGPKDYCRSAGHNLFIDVKEPDYEPWRQHILSLGKPAGIP